MSATYSVALSFGEPAQRNKPARFQEVIFFEMLGKSAIYQKVYNRGVCDAHPSKTAFAR